DAMSPESRAVASLPNRGTLEQMAISTNLDSRTDIMHAHRGHSDPKIEGQPGIAEDRAGFGLAAAAGERAVAAPSRVSVLPAETAVSPWPRGRTCCPSCPGLPSCLADCLSNGVLPHHEARWSRAGSLTCGYGSTYWHGRLRVHVQSCPGSGGAPSR